MQGSELLDAFKKQALDRLEVDSLTEAEFARELGLGLPKLRNLRTKELTAHQIAELMDRYGRSVERRLTESAVVPIVEFLELSPSPTAQGATYQIFSPKGEEGKANRYMSAVRDRLNSAHGIYIFHDSRGRAIYAGKAVLQTLWKEMNLAFNRDRGEVQNIKRAYHPTSRGRYGGGEVKIKKVSVALHDLASYVSAYEIPDGMIGKFEALIVRSFANDLLNVRMESI